MKHSPTRNVFGIGRLHLMMIHRLDDKTKESIRRASMMKPCSNPILLIHSANKSGAKLANYFNDIKQPWVGVHRFTDAAHERQQRKFGMVVCDWELFQVCQADQLERDCLGSLLNDGEPVIFVSSSQSVSVNFKPVMGRSFYSLKAEESSDLFAIISELATKVPASVGYSSRVASEGNAPTSASQSGKRDFLPAPHFSLSQVISPALANSTVHSLY
jgi:hypothetical protein